MVENKEETPDSSPPSKGAYTRKIALWISILAIWGGVVYFALNLYRRMAATTNTVMTTLETSGHDGKGEQVVLPGERTNTNQPDTSRTIFKIDPGKALPSGKGKWARCENPQYRYWFMCPTNWQLSKPNYSMNRAFFLQHPDLKSVAVIVIPFGIGDRGRKLSQEITSAEEAYLSTKCMQISSKTDTINGLSAIRRSYSCSFANREGLDNWKAEVTFVVKGRTCFPIFLRGLHDEIDKALPAYNRMVSTFISEKLPLPPLPAGTEAHEPAGNNPNPPADTK